MTEFAQPNEPLELADGTLINPSDGSVIESEEEEFVEVPTYTELRDRAISVRKRIGDLPAPPAEMNTVSVVLSYSLFGLSDSDIAVQTGLTEEQVGQIKMLDFYAEYQRQVLEGLLESDADEVRGMFMAMSREAAQTMGRIMQTSRIETNRITASKDILDRAGQRPADVVEHKHKMEGGLVIEVIKRQEGQEVPTIDITPEKKHGNGSGSVRRD